MFWESKSSRVKELSTDVSQVTKETSVKAKLVALTSNPKVSMARVEVKEKSDLPDSNVVDKQSTKHAVRSSKDTSHPGNVMYPKRRCFMKDLRCV